MYFHFKRLVTQTPDRFQLLISDVPVFTSLTDIVTAMSIRESAALHHVEQNEQDRR